MDADGSALGSPGESRGGAIVRNLDAVVVWAASFYSSIGTNFQPQVMALLKGLEYCVQQHFSLVEIQTYSKALVELVNARAKGHGYSEFSLNKYFLLLI